MPGPAQTGKVLYLCADALKRKGKMCFPAGNGKLRIARIPNQSLGSHNIYIYIYVYIYIHKDSVGIDAIICNFYMQSWEFQAFNVRHK